MNNLATEIIFFEGATSSDLNFMMNVENFPSPYGSPLSSTRSDAQSAPPDLGEVFGLICDEYSRCVHEAGRQIPPQWTMPDLVQMVLGDEALQYDFLRDAYYDIMLCGTRSWGCEQLLNFVDLINYVI